MPFVVYLAGGFAVVGVLAFLFWPKIAPWVRDSETLFFARLQLFTGAVWAVLSTTNLLPILDLAGLGKWFPVWMAGAGIVTELARRSRAPEL